MRLTELEPRWIQAEGRPGMGMHFYCPCCGGATSIGIYFKNPLDGGEPAKGESPLWERIGDDFETMTIKPSIDGSASGHWHGHITNGEVTG